MNAIPAYLTWADYAIISIIGLSTLISLIRGFVREALSLGVWVMAFLVAFKFSSLLAPSLQSYITSETFRYAAAFALLMLASLIAGAIITHFLSLLINRTGLSGTDRLLGVLFGLSRGIFLVVILLMIGQLSNLQKQPWWANSQMIPQFHGLVYQAEKFLPEKLSEFPVYLESKKKQIEQNARGAVRNVAPSIPTGAEGTGSNAIENIKKTIQNQTGGQVIPDLKSIPNLIKDKAGMGP